MKIAVVVLANDDSVQAGAYIAQGSAASLNRVLKAQSASGQQADVHVHADGSVHVGPLTAERTLNVLNAIIRFSLSLPYAGCHYQCRDADLRFLLGNHNANRRLS